MNRWWLGIIVIMPKMAAASDCGADGKYLFSKTSDSVVYQQVSEKIEESFDRSIAWVSVPTFEVIERDGCDTDYAKDVNRVYYKGETIEEVKPRYFEEAVGLPGIWSADGKWIKDGKIIDDLTDFGNGYYQAGGESFHEGNLLPHNLNEVSGDFGISDQQIFFKGKPANFDPNSFRAFKHYALDAYKLYYYVGSEIVEIKGADPQSFVEFEDQKLLAADDLAYYFEGHVIPSSAEYIEYYGYGFFRDKDRVYFYETPLPEMDPETFKVHLKGGKYIQDKNGGYFLKRLNFRFAEIEYEPLEAPVDYESFRAGRYNIAYDKNTIFETHKVANYALESLNIDLDYQYETDPKLKFYKPVSSKKSFTKKSLPKVVTPEYVKPELPKPKPKLTPKIPRLFSGLGSDENRQKIPRRTQNQDASLDEVLDIQFTWWQRLLNWLLF